MLTLVYTHVKSESSKDLQQNRGMEENDWHSWCHWQVYISGA